MKLISSFLVGLMLTATASATVVGEKAKKIQSLVGPYARNDKQHVKSGAPLDMVKGYIKAKYKDDEYVGNQYKYVRNAKNFTVEETVAGTISLKTAKTGLSSENWSKRQIDYYQSLLEEISEAGGSFGFDGYEQHGCAAPTTFLLIIDPDGQTVYGVDLEPCSES